MSCIIVKPADVVLNKEKVCCEIIFEQPYYIGIAFTDGKKIEIKKFTHGNVDAGWKELTKLTKYPLIAFFGNKRSKAIEKNIENLCPVSLGDCAYIASGDILSLQKKTRKQYTDVFYFKQHALDEMEAACPLSFFEYQGRWMLHRIVPSCSSMAFLNKDGDFSVINRLSGYEFEKMWYFDDEAVNKKSVIPPKK